MMMEVECFDVVQEDQLVEQKKSGHFAAMFERLAVLLVEANPVKLLLNGPEHAKLDHLAENLMAIVVDLK